MLAQSAKESLLSIAVRGVSNKIGSRLISSSAMDKCQKLVTQFYLVMFSESRLQHRL